MKYAAEAQQSWYQKLACLYNELEIRKTFLVVDARNSKFLKVQRHGIGTPRRRSLVVEPTFLQQCQFAVLVESDDDEG